MLPDLNKVAVALDQAANHRVALDVETYDPDIKSKGPGARRDGYIIGFSLAIEDGPAWYLPVRHKAGKNLDPRKIFKMLRAWGKKFKGDLVGANLLYDLEFLALERTGTVTFTGANWLDVQIAEPLLDENLLTYALDSISWDYLGRGKHTGSLSELAASFGTSSQERVKFSREPQQVFWRMKGSDVESYAIADVRDPLEILRKQEAELFKQNLEGVWSLETRLLPVILAMRLQGVRVDVERATKARGKLVKRRKQILSELNQIAGREVSLWVPSTFAPALEEVGLKIPRTPKTNQPSLTKEWLAKANHPYATLYLDGRRIDKTIGTFMDGHILGSALNGRVYPQIHPLRTDENGTISGRFSYSLPNLQQLTSKDETLSAIVRGCFVPEPDEVWESEDYSQIEFRLLTHYALGQGAEEARNAYRNDPKTSFHRLAAEMADLDADDPSTYKVVKQTNFCKVYGGNAKKIAQTAEIPLERAERFVEIYDKKLPFVKSTYKWVDRVAQRRGFIRSLSGRRHRFNRWQPIDWKLSREWTPVSTSEEAIEDLERHIHFCRDNNLATPRSGVCRAFTYRSLNRLLQGGAADFMKEAMVQQWEAGVCAILKAPLVTVHDEEGWSRPRTKIGEEALLEAHRIMENAIKLSVPMLVDRKSGDSWGAIK